LNSDFLLTNRLLKIEKFRLQYDDTIREFLNVVYLDNSELRKRISNFLILDYKYDHYSLLDTPNLVLNEVIETDTIIIFMTERYDYLNEEIPVKLYFQGWWMWGMVMILAAVALIFVCIGDSYISRRIKKWF
jgi:hypothetical protein